MTTQGETRAWFPNVRFDPHARLRLFCFPYAGGGAQIYRNWQAGLPSEIEVCPVQLPGRGSRLKEQGFTSLPALTEELKRVIRPHLDKPFAFFGHSMGGMITFELARSLREASAPQPVHLFIAGRRAPQVSVEEEVTYNLPEEEFKERLRDIKGTPDEVLDHPELMQMMLPLLRADFELVETYEYQPGRLLDCPVSAYGGLEDVDVPGEQLGEWREETTGAFNQRMFPGGHFYLHAARERLLQMVSLDLRAL
ncbi:MAG TPA: alpha/beta fold hydrolase [Pyrinomonadaceae bacterium]|nr:alpha/beta fold hydrolase [Pyrinomonadaceae bacterium]